MSDPRERQNRVFGLQELARAADVSPRTIRYYIAEGVLPPPRLAGPTTTYGPGHLDRLRLIGRLKAAYLPLKEIRRRLAGLGDDEVRALLAEDAAPAPPAGNARDDAATYLDRVLGSRPMPRPGRQAAFGVREPPPPRMEAAPASAWSTVPSVAEPFAAMAAPFASDIEEDAMADDTALLLDAAPAADAGAWRRIALGDDAELLIREEAYRRKQDRVEWLVDWARRVFG